MKQAVVLYLGIVSASFSGAVLPDSAKLDQLGSNFESMNSLIAAMEVEPDEWRIRAAMQEHAVLMNESIKLSEELLDACENGTNDGVCSPESGHRMTMTFMRHVILRQNVVMERLGLFN